MKGRVLLITSILLMNVIFLFHSVINTPVEALNPVKGRNLRDVNASFWGGQKGEKSIAFAGDVNGDGYDDILIGADNRGNGAGHTYLIFGKPTGWVMDTDLSNVDASFIGEGKNDNSGCSVAGAGDVNGDGYDDILIGASWNDDGGGDYAGKTYLIFGKSSGWTMDTDLSDSNASFLGEAKRDYSGTSVAGAGDVNSDGYDDILIGAYGSEGGQTYLIFGKASGWTRKTDLSNVNASFVGENGYDHSGFAIAGAGDVNGDEFDDIVIGAGSNDEGGYRAGQIYLILGKPSGWAMDTNLSSSNASFIGEHAGAAAGRSVAGAGDVNGDGYDDILIGAWANSFINTYVGKTYIIFGKESGWAMDTNLSTSNASFLGEDEGDGTGYSVAGAGDINGDNFDDILIGSFGYGRIGPSANQTYIILGKESNWEMYTDLSTSDLSFIGETIGDPAGCSVAGGGDVNGDGYNDILIGAWGYNNSGVIAGKTYLILPPHNSRPLLYDPIPMSYYDDFCRSYGNTSTNITFSITYEDIDGDEPSHIYLVIDGYSIDMISNDPIPLDFKRGVRYSLILNLTEETHRYFFSASDGKSTVRFPEYGNLTIRIDIILDSDDDGYSNAYERNTGSDPFNKDSTPLDWDGDGWKNNVETEIGTDPRNYSSIPRDQDGDGIPDSQDTDRDGDKVRDFYDPYPDDPTRWERDTDSNQSRFSYIVIRVGLVILAILIVILSIVIYLIRKKRIEKSREAETDDPRKVRKEE